MTGRSRVLVLLATGCSLGVSAQESATVPVERVMVMIQEEQLRPLVSYCTEAVPETEAELTSAFEAASEKAVAASGFLIDLAKDSGETEVPRKDVEEMQSAIGEMAVGLLAVVREAGQPDLFCARLLTQLQSISVEQLEQSMRATFAEYQMRVQPEAGITDDQD